VGHKQEGRDAWGCSERKRGLRGINRRRGHVGVNRRNVGANRGSVGRIQGAQGRKQEETSRGRK
jgi:hypothetical protein